MRTIFLSLVLILGGASAALAQTPAVPSFLSTGPITDTSIAWTVSLSGSQVTELQLFVGDETAPRAVVAVQPNGPQEATIVERNLAPGTRITGRRVRAAYYGVPGAFSQELPATWTHASVPNTTYDPVSDHVLYIAAGEAMSWGEQETAWQVWDATNGVIYDWIRTPNVELTGFDAGNTYTLRFRARNGVGTVTPWSDDRLVTFRPGATVVLPPTTPPAPTITVDGKLLPGSHGTVVTRVRGLNVRTGPGMSAERIAVLKPGEGVVIREVKAGWYRVEAAGGARGWVYGEYVR